MRVEVIIHPDAEALAAAVAARLITSIIDAQAARGRAAVVLTGGGMGGRSQQAVVTSPAARAVDWERVDFYWGDERFLPRGHPDRNETQAREQLLGPLAIAEARIHAMPASDGKWGQDAVAAAAGHALELAELAKLAELAERFDGGGSSQAVPAFDVLMLGMGPDGHIASLFPGHPLTTVTDLTVASLDDSPKPPPQRLTLTFPVLQSARETWLIAAGPEKAEALARALRPGTDRGAIPAAGARGTRRTLALIDRDAASQLRRPPWSG